MRRGFPGLVTAVLVLTMLFGVLACTQPAAPAAPASGGASGGAAQAPAAPAITLKMATYQTPTHLYSQVFAKYIPMVEKVTNGRVKVQVYDSETLAKANEFIDAVQRGVADIAWSFPAYNSATFPLYDEPYLPFVYRDIRGQLDVQINGLDELYLEQLRAKGIDKVGSFGMATSGARYLITKKPVVVPSDLKGVKIRSAGSLEAKVIETAGGAAVSTVASEVYEAIQRGMIDGAMAVHTNIVDWKWMEVAPHLLNMPAGFLHMQMLYNTDSWAKVSPADRPAVEAVMKLTLQALNTDGITVQDYRLTSVMAPKMTYNTPTAAQKAQWQETFKPILGEFKAKSGELGQKALDLIDKYNKR